MGIVNKKCPKCGETKPGTVEFWVVVSETSERGKQYPKHVGRPIGRCKTCRNKAQLGYQKSNKGKKKRSEMVSNWGEAYTVLRSLQTRLRHMEKTERLVKLHGGACTCCGYDKCLAALDFHHTDPTAKSFTIRSFRNKTEKELMEECKKCILLCSNCHRELHEREHLGEIEEYKKMLSATRWKDNKYVN